MCLLPRLTVSRAIREAVSDARLIGAFASVDWADLVTLDLSLYEQPGGKEELVKQLDHAVRNVGTPGTTHHYYVTLYALTCAT